MLNKIQNSFRSGRIFIYAFVSIILLLLILPIVSIPIISVGSSSWLEFPPKEISFTWYKSIFSSSDWMKTAMNSIKVALPVVFLSLLLGVPVSYAIVRGNFYGRHMLNSLFITPMLVPHIIIAIALYALYLKLGINGTYLGLIIAHTLLALPFVIMNITKSIKEVNPIIEYAAQICGANYVDVFFRVTLPLIKNGIITGALFAFFISWDEVILAIFLTTPATLTLPVKMWNSLRLELTPELAAVSTILITISIIIFLILIIFGGYTSLTAEKKVEDDNLEH